MDGGNKLFCLSYIKIRYMVNTIGRSFFYLACLFLLSAANTFAAGSVPTHTIKHLFDIKGSSSARLVLPTDVAVHGDHVYIVDSGNHRVQVYDLDGDYQFKVGKQGIAKGAFRGPIGIDADSSGRFYVADAGNNRVQVFDDSGKYLTSFDVVSKDKLVRPVDVCVSETDKLVYVTGNNNHKVMAFTIGGHLQRSWGGNGVEIGEFRYPATMSLLPDKRIGVVDVLNSRVQLFSPQGKTPIEVGAWGVLPGLLFRPKGIAVDKQSHIYISDSYTGVVQVFNDVGKFIAVLGKNGQPKIMRTPVGMTLDKQNRLYVAEMLANKVSVWKISPFTNGTEE